MFLMDCAPIARSLRAKRSTISAEAQIKFILWRYEQWNLKEAEPKQTCRQHLPVNLRQETNIPLCRYCKKRRLQSDCHIFEETAGNEKEHAKIWFKLLTSGGVAHSSLPDTLTNLKDAAAGENYEWTEMYAEFAKVAKEEGLIILPCCLKKLAKLKKNTKNATMHWLPTLKMTVYLNAKKKQVWICGNCGHIVIAEKAPEVCPVCDHPKAYFELRKVNY